MRNSFGEMGGVPSGERMRNSGVRVLLQSQLLPVSLSFAPAKRLADFGARHRGTKGGVQVSLAVGAFSLLLPLFSPEA